MSSSESDELDGLLADSGSEYDPSSSGDDSDVSSLSSDHDRSKDTDADRKGVGKKRKKTINKNKTRTKVFCLNRVTRRATGANRQNSKLSQLNSSRSLTVNYKSFNELMNDVIFTMSGFINPLRGELRSKAVEMGARYQPDWDSTCTHLICAFPNTPKYRQVRGQGKIVTKEWIENAYSTRKRFPWRRYALDRRDGRKNESEGEIHELVNDLDSGSSPSHIPLSSTNEAEVKDETDAACSDSNSNVAQSSHEVIDNNICESHETRDSIEETREERNDYVSSTAEMKPDSLSCSESLQYERTSYIIEEHTSVVTSTSDVSTNSNNS